MIAVKELQTPVSNTELNFMKTLSNSVFWDTRKIIYKSLIRYIYEIRLNNQNLIITTNIDAYKYNVIVKDKATGIELNRKRILNLTKYLNKKRSYY